MTAFLVLISIWIARETGILTLNLTLYGKSTASTSKKTNMDFSHEQSENMPRPGPGFGYHRIGPDSELCYYFSTSIKYTPWRYVPLIKWGLSTAQTEIAFYHNGKPWQHHKASFEVDLLLVGISSARHYEAIIDSMKDKNLESVDSIAKEAVASLSARQNS